MTRRYSDKVNLTDGATLDFFENRGARVKANDINDINAVLYQDDNPELARARDRHEKDLILPMLELTAASRVLDMGCGIGRWADALSQEVAFYCGTDFSPSLIEIARSRFAQSGNIQFQVMPCQDVSLDALGQSEKFDIAISAGLLIYLNDVHLKSYFHGLIDCLKHTGLLYLREPVAIEQRLTLSGHFSSELNHEYHAIYRTEDELSQFFEILQNGGFSVDRTGWVYDEDSLNNRTETRQKYWILRA